MLDILEILCLKHVPFLRGSDLHFLGSLRQLENAILDSYYPITDEEADELGRILGQLTALQHLALSIPVESRAGAEALGGHLTGLVNLTRFGNPCYYLYRMDNRECDISMLLSGLCIPLPSLTHLVPLS